MSEVTVNGRAFRLSKLDPMAQLAVAIKVMPVLPLLKPIIAANAQMRERIEAAEKAIAEGREPDPVGPDGGLPDEMLRQLGLALNELGDTNRNYVIGACLGAVLMDVGGGFLPAWSAREQKPDASIDLVTMCRLLYAVIVDNISGFSAAVSAK